VKRDATETGNLKIGTILMAILLNENENENDEKIDFWRMTCRIRSKSSWSQTQTYTRS